MAEGASTVEPTATADHVERRRGHRVRVCVREHRGLLAASAIALIIVVAAHLPQQDSAWVVDMAVVLGLVTVTLTTEGRHQARLGAAVRAVDEGERRFRQMAEQGPDVTFRYRIDPPAFEYLSPSWERVTGMPVTTALADRKLALRLISPEDLPRLGRVMTAGTEPGHPEVIHVLRADGASRYAEFQTTVLRGPDGRPTHTIGSIREVTERVNAERARQATDERFRLLAEQSQDVVFEWRHGASPGFAYVSPAFEQLTGYPAQAALDGSIDPLTLIVAADLPALDRALRFGTPPGAPIRFGIHHRDGDERTIELAATLLRDDRGDPSRTVGAARDVTERVETEERLRTSERRFREMADRSRDIIFRYQLRQMAGFSFISQGVARLVGDKAAEAFIGDPTVLERTVHPDDRYLLASLLTSTVPSDDPVTIRWIGADGAVAWTEVVIVPVLGPDGLPDAIDGVARIVTDRVLAQQALKRSEARFREMLTNLQLLAVIVDVEGRCVFANAAAARLAGSTPDGLVGHDLIHLLAPPEHASQARAYHAALLAGMPSDRRDLVIRAADGTEHTLVWDPIVLHDDEGRASGIAAIGEDVTEARRAEADRVRLMAVTEHSADAVAIVDADGTVGYANPAMLERLGSAREETIGRPAQEVLPARLGIPWPMPEAEPEGVWRAERRAPAPDDTSPVVVEELMVTPIVTDGGAITHHVIEAWDVSRVRELEWAVDHAARARSVVFAALHHLDGGSTPEATAEAVVHELRGLPGVDAAAILAFDLPVGGQVLAVDGIDGMSTGTEAPPTAVAYLRDKLAGGPFTERWTEHHPHARLAADGRQVIGVSVGPLLSEGQLVGLVMLASADAEEVRRFAGDLSTVAELSAMVSVLLGPGIREQQRAAATRHELDRVIDETRFEVRYQPVVDLESGAIVGFEATTRFIDPLEPAETLAAAATVGLAGPLETAMLRAATDQAADLPRTAWLGLNLTPGLLTGLDGLADLLRRAGRPVVLELSEHLLIGEYAPLRTSLGALGPDVRLAIDDTGAGQANLAHLVELSAAFVKLDVSLVRGVDADVTRQAMARGILQFAATTGSTVIAEGVETEAELAMLRRLGVTLAQGHLLGRPEPASTWARADGGTAPG